MATIRITPEMERYITAHGKFKETDDDVLRRLTGSLRHTYPDFQKFLEQEEFAEFSAKEKKLRKPGKPTTPQWAYRQPLLRVLELAEGYELTTAEAVRQVGEIIALKPADWELHPSTKQIRWQVNVRFMRQTLVAEGLIEPVEVSGYGVWRLTTAGIAAARKFSHPL